MYNEEQKKEFIRYYTQKLSTAKFAEQFFNVIEPYEKTFERDVVTFSTEELQPVIDNVLGFRHQSKWMGIAILKKYTKWCRDNNVEDVTGSINHVVFDGIEKFKTQMVSGPTHLQMCLNSIFNSEDEEDSDSILRSFYWLGFSGVPRERLDGVKCSDIDFYNMVIRVDGWEYPIYRESIPALKNVATLTAFNYKHENPRYEILRDRVPGEQLLRGIKSEFNYHSTYVAGSVRVKAAYQAGKCNCMFNYDKVGLSGIFYRAYELERAGVEPNFGSIAANYVSRRSHRTESDKSIKVLTNKRKKDLSVDYQRWKLAFALATE